MAWYGCPSCGRVHRLDGNAKARCSDCSRRLDGLSDKPEAKPRLATRTLRLAGCFADQAIGGVLMVALLWYAAVAEATTRPGGLVFISALGWVTFIAAIYSTVLTAIWGMTVGKWVVGIQVVGPLGQVPGWGRALVRSLVSLGAGIITNTCGAGLLDPAWLLWDRNRQTLHDKAAGTVVVVRRARSGAAMLVLSIVLATASQIGLVFAVVRPAIIQSYFIPSGSMMPTLEVHDRLFANKLSFKRGELRRRDIVVFRAPLSAYYSNPQANPDLKEKKDFIKRLVALPGDELKVDEGSVWLKKRGDEDFSRQAEPYLREPFHREDFGPVTVPEGHVLVFGDNRNNSNDSKKWVDVDGEPAPFLPIENIHGRAFARFWPVKRIGDIPGG